MKVLVLHWGRNGGGPRYHLGLVNALQHRPGISVRASWSRQADVALQLADSGVPGCLVTTFDGPFSSLRLDRLLQASWRLRRYVGQESIDAVVVSMAQVWQGPAVWALPQNVPLLFTVHDSHEHPGESRLVRWTRPLTTWLEMSRADGIICLSSTVASAVRRQVSDRIPVTTSVHAVDAPASAVPRRHPGAGPVIGFFGRLMSYKGVDLLIAAAPMLRRRFPGLTVQIFGHGPIDLSSEEGVEVHRGWVHEPQIKEIVAGFDVLVLPYREASQSGVLGLATSQGVPVVATPVGGLVEQVQLTGAGVVAEAVTPEALVKAISCVLEDEDRYTQLSLAGLESAADTVSWRRVADDYVSAVRSLPRKTSRFRRRSSLVGRSRP